MIKTIISTLDQLKNSDYTTKYYYGSFSSHSSEEDAEQAYIKKCFEYANYDSIKYLSITKEEKFVRVERHKLKLITSYKIIDERLQEGDYYETYDVCPNVVSLWNKIVYDR